MASVKPAQEAVRRYEAQQVASLLTALHAAQHFLVTTSLDPLAIRKLPSAAPLEPALKQRCSAMKALLSQWVADAYPRGHSFADPADHSWMTQRALVAFPGARIIN